MKTRFFYFLRQRGRRSFSLVSVFLSYIVSAEAQLFWGAEGAGGSGVWDATMPNWSDGTRNVPWTQDGVAVFAGAPGTVMLSAAIGVSALTFDSTGYTVRAGALISPSAGMTIHANADATILSEISRASTGPGVFAKNGAGTLTVNSSLASFGTMRIEAGELNLLTLGAAAKNIDLATAEANGAALSISSLTISSLTGGGVVQPVQGVTFSTLSIAGAGGRYAGLIRDSGSTPLNLSIGPGLQEFASAQTFSGATTVGLGTLAFSENGSALNTPIRISGGTLLLDNSATAISNRISDTAPLNLTGTIVFSGNSAATATESIGQLVIGSSASSVVVTPHPTQSAALNFASLSPRNSSSTGIVTFSGPSLGQAPGPGVANIYLDTRPTLIGGGDLLPEAAILPGALSFSASRSTFVTYGANGVRPLADTDYASRIADAAFWENVSVNSAQNLSTNAVVNALRLQNGAAITSTATLTVRSGVILTHAGNASITTSALDFDQREAIFINEGNLTVTSGLTASNTGVNLTKSGAGRLTLGGVNQAGRVDVLQGVLRLEKNATAATTITIRAGAALELAGGAAVNSTSTILNGNGPDGRGALRSVDGDNRMIGRVTLVSSSNVDVVSGSLSLAGTVTVSSLIKTGAGNLILTNPLGAGTISVHGGGTLTSTASSGAPFGKNITVNGSTLRLAPATSRVGAHLELSLPGTFSYAGGSSTLALDKGGNAGVTFTIGATNAFGQLAPATFLIAPGGGLAALGITEKIRLNSTSDTAMPTTNGIVTAPILGQDNDANRSGDFLTYTAATGFKPATYSTITSLNAAGTSTVFDATTPQMLTANASVYALKNTSQVINLAGRSLTIGEGRTAGTLILNGGFIQSGTITFGSSGGAGIYTSLAGGTISSAILGSSDPYYSRPLSKIGPGVLTLSGRTSRNVLIQGGGLRLDSTSQLAGTITLARGTTLSGNGRASGAVVGGLISPGNGVGILTAGTTGPTDVTASGLNESFAPTAFAFEFTQVLAFEPKSSPNNDVLRLTNLAQPIFSPLTAANEIDLYLAPASGVSTGQSFRGGFFTDRNASFLDFIDDATFCLFLRDEAGATVFNGLTYSERADLLIAIATVPQSGSFGEGNVNGFIMEVRIVPEPSITLLLLFSAIGFVKRRRTPSSQGLPLHS